MSKILAIKGHPTRGKEIITLLEMMGGYADELVDNGTDERYAYFILEEENNAIDGFPIDKKDEFEFDTQIFTLEEFLEKYPFKVGDKVNSPCKGCIKTITSMKWDDYLNTVSYKLDDKIYTTIEQLKVVNDLPYKETDDIIYSDSKYKRTHEDVIFDSIIWHLRNSANNGKHHLSGGDCETYFRELVKRTSYTKNELIDLIPLTSDSAMIAVREGFEIIEDQGKFFVKKKKTKYPTTYEECWKVRFEVDGETTLDEFHHVSGYFSEPLGALQRLLCCRDAYWKIAGEEMGLDKLWEPKFGKYILYSIKFYLYQDSFVLHKGEYSSSDNCILVFPSEEMRDAFYENFKNLIEQCKELL